MKTKLQGLCPSYRPLQALAASVYLLAAVLLASCTTEAEKTDRTVTDGTDSVNKREVLISFKNKLTVNTTQAGTKAETKAGTEVETKADAPIATEAENEIATLDIYVFGAKAEGDAYTFRERFAYRQDDSALPAGAKKLDLTPGTDNATTTALLELQKGLFVRFYCIANQTDLINPVDGNPVAGTYFDPLEYDVETGVLTDGIPTEGAFLKLHSPLLTASSEALGIPLPMTGAQTTPVDLTDFGSSARVQVGFKLTRTMARFDISNKETDSKFHIESISMGNGRKGTTFFPAKVYGATPAADGELITYPARAFEGDKANTGLQVSAFYSYPSPLEDKGYLILNGTYQVNQTETKAVSYRIPFRQQTADGGSVDLEINANHRYIIGITKADEYHLDFTLDVADWADSGDIDDYDPEISDGDYSLTVIVADPLKDKITYDAVTNMVTMKTLKDGDSFIIEVNASREPELKKSYAGSQAVQQYDWLEVSAATPVTKSTVSGYQYTVSPKPGYDKDKYPQAVLRFTDSVSGTEAALSVTVPPFKKPVLSSPEAVTLHAEANNEIPEIIITGQCVGGSEISGPDWLTYETIGTDEETFSYKVQLIPSLTGFPESVPAEQILTITNKRVKSLTATVKVNFTETEPWMTDLTGYIDDSEHDPQKGYRVTPSGKTLTISYYSMFTEPKRLSSDISYDPAYCTNANGGNSWLNVIYSKSIEGNRCKYTYSIQIAPAIGADPEYQLHKATLRFKQEGTEVQSYTIWRGVSYVGYPMESGSASPYYTAIKKGAYYWAPVNCGATRVARGGDGKNGTVAGTGNLYQWGRYDYTNYGGSTASGPTGNSRPNNHIFYTASNSPYNWFNSQNNTLWNGSSKGTNDPCPAGYRVPTSDELMSIGNATTWDGSGGLFKVNAESGYPQLILPAAGYRNASVGSSSSQGSYGFYWSSSVLSGNTGARNVLFNSATFSQSTFNRAYGFSVRCLRE